MCIDLSNVGLILAVVAIFSDPVTNWSQTYGKLYMYPVISKTRNQLLGFSFWGQFRRNILNNMMFTSVCIFGRAGFEPAPDYFPAGGFWTRATLYLDTKGAPSARRTNGPPFECRVILRNRKGPMIIRPYLKEIDCHSEKWFFPQRNWLWLNKIIFQTPCPNKITLDWARPT
jgi:hypothetical protein